MTNYFVDYLNGNNANSGLSQASRKKTIDAITAGPGDVIRLAQSSNPVLQASGVTWPATGGRNVLLAAPITTNISTCDTAWTGFGSHATAMSSSTRKEGFFSQLIATDSSFTTGPMAYTFINVGSLSGSYTLSMWIKPSQDIAAGDVQLLFTQFAPVITGTIFNTINLPAARANQWVPITVSGITPPSTIPWIQLVANASLPSFSIYMDNIFISNQITLRDLVCRDGSLTGEANWAIKSVNGTTLVIDQDPQSLAGQGQGYFNNGGVSTNLYVRGTIPTALVAGNTPVQSLVGTGPTISGGWDSASMSSVVGETWFDGQNGLGLGLNNTNAGSTFHATNVSWIRYNQGLEQDVSIFNTATNVNIAHNTTVGAIINSNTGNFNVKAYGNGGNDLTILGNNNTISNGLIVSAGNCGIETLSFATIFTPGTILGNNAGGNFCINPNQLVQNEDDLPIQDTEVLEVVVHDSEGLGITDLAVPNVGIANSDSLSMSDVGTEGVGVPDPEGLGMDDGGSISGTFTTELLDISDSIATNVTISNEDDLPIDDSSPGGTEQVWAEDDFSISDSNAENITIYLEDDLEIDDSESQAGEIVQAEDNLSIQDSFTIAMVTTISGGMRIQIAIDQTATYSNQISVLADSHVPTTSLTNPANVMQPSLYVGGVPIVTNPSTAPVGSLGDADVFVNFLAAGLPICDIYNFNLNFEFGGGTWSISTVQPWAALGDKISIFGMVGLVTRFGKIANNSANGYITKGIFGSANLNKQLLLVANEPASQHLAGLIPNQYLNQPPTSQWSTISNAARAIAGAANLSLYWAAKDAPLTDLFPESGTTVMSALQSLAGRVKGIVCWDGNSTYVVINPNQGWGQWGGIPDCNMLAPGGVTTEAIQDIEDAIILLPINTTTGNTNISLVPSALTPVNPLIYTLSNYSVVPSASTPAAKVDVPGDFFAMYAQNVVTDPSGVTGPFITTNPNTWTKVNTPPIETDPDTGKRYFSIGSSFFPVGASGFRLNVGYARNDGALTSSLNQQISEAKQKQNLVTEAQLDLIRYFRTNESTINTFFFGSVPLPGMRIVYALNNISFQGIIETVSISSPGYMTLSIGTYQQISFISPKALLDAQAVNLQY